MAAPSEIEKLVERFDRNREQYLSPGYNETELRQEFLNPFFSALGWDIENRQGYAEPYKDVIHEDAIKVGSATKAPDYSFRIGGMRKFFVEAKRPSVHIKEDAAPAFQLRRYAWSAKLPLSLLTDFEELAVYDCRIKPTKHDAASVGRLNYLTFADYIPHWDEIASVFSREAVLTGSFDKYAESAKGKKGTTEVDDAFLKEIESWRDQLARNIAIRNPKLTQRELNFAVQKTIDRIIFLRICEDRGIETYGSLQALVNGERTYKRLCEQFYRADEKYNSGLFHFQEEKDRGEAPDSLTLDLHIDDKPLIEIIGNLYYPDCPYEFSVLPADILGQVYEQFLGKVIRLTAGHQAKVEDKPEVKKAGGVYYTLTYIVDYIVKNTVGKLVEGKTPKQIANIHVLDPACGSGSFLIGAYQYLLNWHRDWYVKDGTEKWAKGKNQALYQGQGGDWRLTTAERKRILLNNIYGVDIDSQAVEVTKLSLLLKVLEGENEESITQQLKMFHERALPDLGSNIKCGNSLIGTDFYDNGQLTLIDNDERTKVNAFDWKTEYNSIFAAGGFDAVIGNPPYGATLDVRETEYLKRAYVVAKGGLDTYALFIEKGLTLCRPTGFLGQIVPTGWYSGAHFGPLRRLIATQSDPCGFVNLPYDVFDAWVDTTVFVTMRRKQQADWPRQDSCVTTLQTFPKRHKILSSDEMSSNTAVVDFTKWFLGGADEFLTYVDNDSSSVLRKMSDICVPLSTFADIQRGVTPFQLTSKPTHSSSRRAFNGTIRRYQFDIGELAYVRFDETLAEPKPARYFEGKRILLRELISRQFRLQAMFVDEEFVTNKSMQSILPMPGGPDILFLLGLLNSRLMSWYFLQKSQVGQRDDFPKIVLKETRQLPIKSVASEDSQGRDSTLAIVSAVGTMISLTRQLNATTLESDRVALQRQIDATDKQIDSLVYELYGLTEEEIKIVEAR